MKLFLTLFVLSATWASAQTSQRSGIFNSASSKSAFCVPFQSRENSSTPLTPGYGSGFLIPIKGNVSSVTNIVELESVKTYPNPASSVVTLEFKNVVNKTRIFDIKGNVVYTCDENLSIITLDVISFSAGLYRVVAMGNGVTYISTFIISK
jgi:hypothetical protein